VTQQGPFEKLNRQQGYVHDLMIKPQEERSNLDGEEISQAQHSTQPKLTLVDDVAKDKARKTGDLSVYAFYFRSIGSSRALVFILTALLLVFCQRFSRKYHLPCFGKPRTKIFHKRFGFSFGPKPIVLALACFLVSISYLLLQRV
jgi:hypothetical protein